METEDIVDKLEEIRDNAMYITTDREGTLKQRLEVINEIAYNLLGELKDD